MAEPNMDMDVDRLQDEGRPPQDDPAVSHSNPADADSGDGEDYSSGSDRSFEADDDSAGRDSLISANNQGNADENRNRSRRKRRHGSHGSRRQKGGSRHKHKGFHPYLPKDEIKRKSLEIKEKENAAAVLRRDDGDQEFVTYPGAPFNSTQFLMDEHNVASPAGLHKTASSSKLETNSPYTLSSVQSTPLETNVDTSNWEKQNQKDNKEFAEIYTTVHAESLQSLPKEELVKHYMNLEEQVAELQKKVAEQNKKEDGSKFEGEADKDSSGDAASVSDTNSLSSANEEFVDLSGINQPTISVGNDIVMNNPSKFLQESNKSKAAKILS